jgi:hypothetical protein
MAHAQRLEAKFDRDERGPNLIRRRHLTKTPNEGGASGDGGLDYRQNEACLMPWPQRRAANHGEE